MTERDELFEMLDRLNPVPDAGALYRDRGDAERLRAAVELRRRRSVDTPRPRLITHPAFGPPHRGWLVAATAFTVVLIIGAAGLLLTRSATGDLGPTAAGTLPPTSAPPAAAGSTTTTAPVTTDAPATTPAPATTTSTTTSATTTTTAPATTTTAPLPTTSILGSPEPPPPGVDPEVPWLMGEGAALCMDFWDYVGPPTIERDQVGYTGGQGPFFCVLGFDPEVAVEVTVTADGMPARSSELDPLLDGTLEAPGFAFVWRSFPDDPLGEHVLQATQGPQTASIVFDVIPPTSSGIIVEPRRASAGEPVDVFLFGHEPNSNVTVHVYHQPDAKVDAVYVTSAVVAIDPSGWGALHIDTGTSDPPGIYQFITDPASDMWVWAVPPYAQSVLELGP